MQISNITGYKIFKSRSTVTRYNSEGFLHTNESECKNIMSHKTTTACYSFMEVNKNFYIWISSP